MKPSSNKSTTIPSYFQATDKKEKKVQKYLEVPKMANTEKQKGKPMEAEVPVKPDFAQFIECIDKLEGSLLEKINNLLKPLMGRLASCKNSRRASAMAITHQEEIKKLQINNEQLHEQF